MKPLILLIAILSLLLSIVPAASACPPTAAYSYVIPQAVVQPVAVQVVPAVVYYRPRLFITPMPVVIQDQPMIVETRPIGSVLTAPFRLLRRVFGRG